MKYYLKTKEECDAIVARNDAFLRADRVVEGFNVAIYDYRLASISDFVDDEAFELRGLTFVENPETGEWERNLLMNKFFNINQSKFNDNISWLYDDVKDKKITRVQNKEDGSICSFVKFPNGSIRAKSKTSFESDQAKMAQEFFDRKSIMKEEVDHLLSKGKTPVFELVSPENQIVLEYQKTELVLLQIRNEDGTYMSEKDLKWHSMIMCINQAENYKLNKLESIANEYTIDKAKEKIGDRKFQSFDEMIEFLLKNASYNKGKMTVLDLILLSREYIENQEGEVITFEDGQMAKVKNLHYLALHGLMGPDAFRENLLISTILRGEIDDVISALVPGTKKDKIVTMNEKVSHKFNDLVDTFIKLRGEYFNKYQENRKEFALAHKNNPLFGSVMKTLNTSFRDVEKTAENAIKEYILRQCKTLGSAKEFVEGL